MGNTKLVKYYYECKNRILKNMFIWLILNIILISTDQNVDINLTFWQTDVEPFPFIGQCLLLQTDYFKTFHWTSKSCDTSQPYICEIGKIVWHLE